MEANGILLFYRNYNSKNPFEIQQLREEQKLKDERLAYEMAQEEKMQKIKSKLAGEFSSFQCRFAMKKYLCRIGIQNVSGPKSRSELWTEEVSRSDVE